MTPKAKAAKAKVLAKWPDAKAVTYSHGVEIWATIALKNELPYRGWLGGSETARQSECAAWIDAAKGMQL